MGSTVAARLFPTEKQNSFAMSTTTTHPSVEEVARDLVALCQANRWEEAAEKYYADNIVSVEAAGPDREAVGLAAVKAKSQWWFENHAVHSAKVEGPFLGDGKFVVRFAIDVTFKPTGLRRVMDELGLYTVVDGKVTHEQFFYNAQ